MAGEVQSVLFSRNFGMSEAKKWLRDHGYKYGKVDITSGHIRFRQSDPRLYKKFRMHKVSNVLSFVIGYK